MIAEVKEQGAVGIYNSGVENEGIVLQRCRHGDVREQQGQTVPQRKATWEQRVTTRQAGAVSSPPKDAVPQRLSRDSVSRDSTLSQTQPSNSQASP